MMLPVAKGLSHGYVWLRCWVDFKEDSDRGVIRLPFLFFFCVHVLFTYGWRLDSSSLDTRTELELGEFVGFYIFLFGNG